MALIRRQGIRADRLQLAFQHAEIRCRERIDADLRRLAHLHEADVAAFNLHPGLQVAEWHDLHHGLTALGHETRAGGLEIEHQPIHR